MWVYTVEITHAQHVSVTRSWNNTHAACLWKPSGHVKVLFLGSIGGRPRQQGLYGQLSYCLMLSLCVGLFAMVSFDWCVYGRDLYSNVEMTQTLYVCEHQVIMRGANQRRSLPLGLREKRKNKTRGGFCTCRNMSECCLFRSTGRRPQQQGLFGQLSEIRFANGP